MGHIGNLKVVRVANRVVGFDADNNLLFIGRRFTVNGKRRIFTSTRRGDRVRRRLIMWCNKCDTIHKMETWVDATAFFGIGPALDYMDVVAVS